MGFLVEIKGLVSLVNIYRRAPDLEIIANNIVVVVQFSIKPLIISDFGPVWQQHFIPLLKEQCYKHYSSWRSVEHFQRKWDRFRAKTRVTSFSLDFHSGLQSKCYNKFTIKIKLFRSRRIKVRRYAYKITGSRDLQTYLWSRPFFVACHG